MKKEGNRTKLTDTEAIKDTADMPDAIDTGVGRKNEPIRLTHHTEKVAFPRGGKKAKSYFRDLEDGYSRCWCVGKKGAYESELAYYQKRYGAMVEARNQACAKNRHAERMLSVEDLYGRQRTCPEVLAIQAGRKNRDEVLDRKLFESCIMQYLSWMRNWSRGHGGCLHVLNTYISKKPPYRAVIRRVWDCVGKDGLRKVSMTGALRAAGVPYPDPEAEESRFNNRKITFDRMSREALYACFEKAGIPVNREPGIHTLRKAMEVKEKTDAEEQCARDMLREIMEVEAQAPPMVADGEVLGILAGTEGGVLVPEGDYRMLKLRECLAGAYASKNQAADVRLVAYLDEERMSREECSVQRGIHEVLELEYTVLRIGLLRCGYYAGNVEGGRQDEGIP